MWSTRDWALPDGPWDIYQAPEAAELVSVHVPLAALVWLPPQGHGAPVGVPGRCDRRPSGAPLWPVGRSRSNETRNRTLLCLSRLWCANGLTTPQALECLLACR